jgi:LPP20 lipoprotein
MRAVRVIMYLCAAVVLVLAGSGCGSAKKPNQGTMVDDLKDAPYWVMNFRPQDDKSGKYIYGVGSVEGTRNFSLARQGATQQARANVAATMNTRVEALTKTYASNTNNLTGDGTNAVDEQALRDGFKAVVEGSVSGVEPIETWVSPGNKVFVLVRLDIQKFKNTAREMGQLSEALRKAIDARADDFWREIDQETSKR